MSKNRLETRLLDEPEYSRWDDFVAGAPWGSIYGTTTYLDALCSGTGGGFRILGAYRGEELVGGIGLYEEPYPFGTVVSNRLLLYYNGPVLGRFRSSYPSKDTSRAVAVLSALEERVRSLGYGRVQLQCRGLGDVRPFVSRGWSARPSYTYVVSLGEIGTTWKRIEQNQRRLVQRCEENGAVLSEDDDFESFYDLHDLTHRRKGAPLYLAREPFRAYFRKLAASGMARLFHARLGTGEAIASQLVLTGSFPETHTVCAGASPEHMSRGSTPFLRWKVFEELSRSGHEANDLTDAALNEITRFKSQLGGDLVMNLVVQRPDRPSVTFHRACRKLFRRAAVWQKLPAGGRS